MNKISKIIGMSTIDNNFFTNFREFLSILKFNKDEYV